MNKPNGLTPNIKKKTNHSNDKKTRSLNSIILRGYVMMRILNANYGYSFILEKERRKAEKHVLYFGIDKIFNREGEPIFDIDEIDLKAYEKTRYSQLKSLQIMKDELTKNGYEFVEEPTRQSAKKYGQYDSITANKIKNLSFKYDGNTYSYSMGELEDSIGVEALYTYTNLFRAGVDYILICNQRDKMNLFCKYSIDKPVFNKSETLILEECFDHPIEFKVRSTSNHPVVNRKETNM